MILLYILVAVLIFGILIMTHELGHFVVAKLCGVRVNEFSICMGPKIFQKKIGETTYSLRCLPIGGFCAMEGEDEKSQDPRAFTSAKAWKRAAILVAGSAMNFLTGFLIMVVLHSTLSTVVTTKIEGFYEGCPLESEQGLQAGDEIYRIDGHRVYLNDNITMLLGRNADGVYDLEIIRDGKHMYLHDFPMVKQNYETDQGTAYLYGLTFATEECSFGTVLEQAWYRTIDFGRMVWLGLSDLIGGLVSVKEMSGPVGIVSVISETGKASATTADAVLNIAYLAAFIAVNLAVMNMLPIPALDGGRVFFLIITTVAEKLFRRKIDPKYEGYIHAAGMILLLLLIAFITLQDVWKLFLN